MSDVIPQGNPESLTVNYDINLATGGPIEPQGIPIVGEPGPEVVTFPPGAQVFPQGNPANTVDPPTMTVKYEANTAAGWPWANATAAATAGAPLHMGNVSWQNTPMPGPYTPPPVPITWVPPLTEERAREIFIEMLASPVFCDVIRQEIHKTLDDLAREIRKNTAFQPRTTKQAGICWACLCSGDDMEWFTRGGHSHLIHKSEECRRMAAEKPETREHRG